MKLEQQAIIARDLIHMIRQYHDDAGILEYLEGFAFAIARGVEPDSPIPWDGIASVCDQRYASLNSASPLPLDTETLDECERAVISIIKRA